MVEGYSSLDNEQVTISRDPFAATWLQVRDDRTPRLRLVANTHYWNTRRGPHLAEVIFRNDLSPQQALELVCTTEGEVDIVTEVSPQDASRVEASEYAKLVALDALRSMVGIINRDAKDLPLGDYRGRLALNFAVDRDRLVREGMHERAQPLAGLRSLAGVTPLHRLLPYPHDPRRARELWRAAAGDTAQRPLRLAATPDLERIVPLVATDLREALGIEVEIRVYGETERLDLLRRLAEKQAPPEWDVLLYDWNIGQTADAPPLELHRGFVGASGEFRAGRVIPEFEELYAQLVGETNKLKMAHLAYRIDKFVYETALALFLCSPQSLYAVNKQVDFTPYRTTFELPECRVNRRHWSRR